MQRRFTRCDKIRTCKWLFQQFLSAERAFEFPCVRHATGENTRKPDNAENTRTQPVRFSILALFSQLAAVRCEASRFFPLPQILRLRIYEYTYTSNPTQRNTIMTIACLDCCRIRFFKKFSANVEFCTVSAENIGLNLCKRDFVKLDRSR